MKIRDSGMPDRATWEGFFDPGATLQRLGLEMLAEDIVDFGCGYGTFALAAAALTRGTVHALDIDPNMIETTAARASQLGVSNVRATERDFVAGGSGLASDSVGYAMLFNVLHSEDAVGLLREARRVLRPCGVAAIVHWIHDGRTPRGPDLSIRPRPEQCSAWAREAGLLTRELVMLPPYHYGLTAQKPP